MEVKVVVADPKEGKSYQRELDDSKARKFKNLRLGEEIDGSLVELPGYKLLITGGSDKSGFPMRKGVEGTGSVRILSRGGVGYRPRKKGLRRRKRVRGEVIDEDIAQINTKIISYGKKKVTELWGIEEKKEDEEEKKS